MMKALGYQRLISVENFRKPNFELVANVLFWLTIRYDPGAEISDDISDEVSFSSDPLFSRTGIFSLLPPRTSVSTFLRLWRGLWPRRRGSSSTLSPSIKRTGKLGLSLFVKIRGPNFFKSKVRGQGITQDLQPLVCCIQG